jgi:hypothetical protein
MNKLSPILPTQHLFARKLQLREILKPCGNGFFDENNLGVVAIEHPMNLVGKEVSFFVYRTNNVDYIKSKNMILVNTSNESVWSARSPESTIFNNIQYYLFYSSM